MKRYLKVLKQCVVASSLVFSMTAFAESDAEQNLRNLLKQYDGFTANFSQKVVDSSNNLLHQAKGRLKFEQPGKFIWEIIEPEPELLISDGTTLWWHNPFIEQVTIFDASQAVAQTPFALLVSQEDSIWSQFSITQSDSSYIISPTSLEQAQVIQLKVAFANQLLAHIEVIGRSMQVSQYTLSDQTFVDVNDSKFKFSIPQGTDIDDQRKLNETAEGNVKY